MTLYGLVGTSEHFKEECYLHFQGRWKQQVPLKHMMIAEVKRVS
jgi:hypothetical protein